ncbi:ribbon-helix-helix protein, CopG family [Truepera radiovictrix]|nr:ribbon-helix-helix protein, CopG family [Truepera radiovictrix]WMT57350.1 ribbon-helix-helix protein, CopG family [Truepera radiovictrix]
MERTTVLLPPELKARAERAAKAAGVSLGELIRSALEARVAQARDPLFADEVAFPEDTEPDLALEHDRYLYDDGR